MADSQGRREAEGMIMSFPVGQSRPQLGLILLLCGRLETHVDHVTCLHHPINRSPLFHAGVGVSQGARARIPIGWLIFTFLNATLHYTEVSFDIKSLSHHLLSSDREGRCLEWAWLDATDP